MPQAMSWLWPMTTPGMPEKVYPATSYGQDALTLLQCRPIWYQSDGICGARCGSLASSGLPVVVYLPETTQELEPMPLPLGPSSAGTELIFSESVERPWCSPWVAPLPLPCVPLAVEVELELPFDLGSNCLVSGSTAPPSTIGLLRLYGYGG